MQTILANKKMDTTGIQASSLTVFFVFYFVLECVSKEPLLSLVTKTWVILNVKDQNVLWKVSQTARCTDWVYRCTNWTVWEFNSILIPHYHSQTALFFALLLTVFTYSLFFQVSRCSWFNTGALIAVVCLFSWLTHFQKGKITKPFSVFVIWKLKIYF